MENNVSYISKTFMFGDQEVLLETGKVARQATASVMVTMAETTVLVAVVARPDMKPGQDFFPLTVNYEEKNICSG
jgi:polyribonucleotide nucleotidyltransferase